MRAYERKTHRGRCICALAALLAALLTTLPWTAQAQGTGAIEIQYAGEGKVLAGAVFSLYRVADASEDLCFTATGAFADCPVDLTAQTAEEWRALAETLAGYALSVTPDAVGTTGAQGELRFGELLRGLYLLVGDELADGLSAWQAEPALVFVDGETVAVKPKAGIPEDEMDLQVIKVWKDKGNEKKRPAEITVELYRGQDRVDTVALSAANNWRYTWKGLSAGDWRVVETTRVEGYTVLSTHEGSEYVITNSYTEPGTPPPGDKLPQTGLLWWPVSLLAVAGMALFLLGWIRHRRGER